VLDDPVRGRRLLEQVRYRTGLLVERRPGVFAFAHLTFQEYLAAQAIHEGNRLGLGANDLVDGQDDPRWQEVIALYCGITTDAAALGVIRGLIEQPNTRSLGTVISEAYRAAQGRIGKDKGLRARVLERIALSPSSGPNIAMEPFPEDEVAPVANHCLGIMSGSGSLSESFWWLLDHGDKLDIALQLEKLVDWRKMDPRPLSELIFHVHRNQTDDALGWMRQHREIYFAPPPSFNDSEQYGSQGDIALMGLAGLKGAFNPLIVMDILPSIFQAILNSKNSYIYTHHGYLYNLFGRKKWQQLQSGDLTGIDPELIPLARELSNSLQEAHLKLMPVIEPESPQQSIEDWIAHLESLSQTPNPSHQKPPEAPQ
jgi:hypothetical protein